jgi:hypothetical protein
MSLTSASLFQCSQPPAEKFIPNLSDFFDFLPLDGEDKPRHYKRSFTEQVEAGFIPVFF